MLEVVALVVVLAIATTSVASVVFVVRTSQVRAERGWIEASSAERHLRHLMAARITTLENRLDSRSLEEFAQFQQIPDEIAKAGWAEQNHSQSTPSQLAWEQRVRDQGADLEDTDNFEGSVIG